MELPVTIVNSFIACCMFKVSLQLTIVKKSSNTAVTKTLDQALIITVLITKCSLEFFLGV